MDRTKRILRDLLFPPRCNVCGEVMTDTSAGRAMCRVCYEKFRTEVRAGCAVCGHSYDECFCRPPIFLPDDFAFALPYNKLDGVCRKLILSCKNRKNQAVMALFADYAVSAAEKRGILREDLVLTYVPRAPEKRVHTGVDQAEELAKAVSARTGLALHRFLGHGIFSEEQKSHRYTDRAPAAEAAYRRLPGVEAMIAGKTILLVDDVVTTGATVNACTTLLREAGAAAVYCLAAAKNIKSDREFSRYITD